MKKIIIVGSGSNKKIFKKKNTYYICCNSSIKRFSSSYYQCIAISESIIGDKKKIFSSKIKIAGLNKLQSNKIRQEKINLFKKVICQTLLIYSYKSEKEIKQNILKLGIKYKYLEILSHRKIFCRIVKNLKINKVKIFLKKLNFIDIFKFIIFGKLPRDIKPSVGGVALLWAKSKFDNADIFVDGVGINNRVYYPFGGKIKKFVYKSPHREIDKLIIQSVLSKNKKIIT